MLDTLAIIAAVVALVIFAVWKMVDMPDERYTELDRDYPRKPWEED